MRPRPGRILLSVGALAILCALGAGAAGAEEFQPLEAKIAPGFSPGETGLEAGLWMEVEQMEKKTRNSPTRVRDEAINQYLRGILCRLSPDYCEDVRLYITRVPYFNAFMTPNGMMVVWSGLLLRVRNEAQLAAILGHELGHYLRRHGLENFQNAKNTNNLLTLLGLGLNIAAATASPPGGDPYFYGNVNQIAGLVLIAGYFAHSRAGEREADKFGIQLMTAAGYDPFEAAAVWKNLIEEDARARRKRKEGLIFFATHPRSEDRLETLDAYARALTKDKENPGEKGAERFARHMAPHWRSVLDDQLKLNQPGKAEFLLENMIKDNVVPGVAHFYKGEIYRRRKEGDDLVHARRHYEQALRYGYFLPETYRALGLLQLKQKELPQAMNNLRTYLEYAPEAEDRQMIEFYLSTEP